MSIGNIYDNCKTMETLIQIGALFILMAVGFALGKLKILEEAAIKGLSALVIKAALPALILMSLQRPFSKELLADSLQTLWVASLFYIVLIALSFLAVRLMRTPPKQAGALIFALSFSNSGFVGFPVVISILGQDALFLAAIHNILFNLLAFSLGIAIVSGLANNPASTTTNNPASTTNVSPLASFKFPARKLLNINVLAALAGFALFLTSTTIPQPLALPLNLLGSTTTPLAMLVVGTLLARASFKSVVGDWRLYAVSALRLLVWPLLAWAALKGAGIGGYLLPITVIVAGMPCASNTSLIAEVYGGDGETASSVIFLSTLFSVATIPIMALLL